MKNLCIHLPLSITLHQVTCLYSKPQYIYSSDSLFVILHSLLALTYNELFFHCISLIIQHIEICIFIYLQVSWGSVVGTAMKINKEKVDIWILAGVRDFSILQNVQTSTWPTQPPIQWVQEFFPGGEGRRLGCNEPFALSIRVKYGWHTTSIPPVCF